MSDNSGNILLGLFIVGGLGYALLVDDKPRSTTTGDAMAADAAALAVPIPTERYYPDAAELPAVEPVPKVSENDALANALAAIRESQNGGVPLSSHGGGYSSRSYGYGDYEDEDRPRFDEYDAQRQAEREMALRGYDYSYGCTVDCSGHEAGWQWRAETGAETYGNPYGYGNSQSFGEGAVAFEEAVRGRVEEMRDEYDSGNDYPY